MAKLKKKVFFDLLLKKQVFIYIGAAMGLGCA